MSGNSAALLMAGAAIENMSPGGSTVRVRSEELVREAEEPRKRVAIEFSRESYARLNAIREACGASSSAEVIRNALRLYDFLLQNRRQGWAIHLVKDNHVKELELLM